MPKLTNELVPIVLMILAMSAVSLGAAYADNAPGKASSEVSSAATNFSIETEMLTYRALESNGEAIACDVAAYLNGSKPSFTVSEGGSNCTVGIGTTSPTVILLPFDSSQLADFQIWRADMATMARFHDRAKILCASEPEYSQDQNPSKSGSRTATTAATSVVGDVVSKTPAGPALAIAQSVLALMASEQSASSVGGTIRDQAFMDGVGRELRKLSVSVLMPTAYTPYSLAMLDKSTSPFLASLDRILDDRGVCQRAAAKQGVKEKKGLRTTANVDPSGIQTIVSDINTFLSTLVDASATGPKPTPATNAKSSSKSSPTPSGDESQDSRVGDVASSPSHLRAVILADGLAEKLGVDVGTGTIAAGREGVLHVLLVKALESGGSVSRFSNVFGTTISYSGGSVGTYALFTINGELECSGNVYEYGGSLNAKDFQNAFRNYVPDPAKQMVFLRRSCHPLPQVH